MVRSGGFERAADVRDPAGEAAGVLLDVDESPVALERGGAVID
jgi:hypothetical protein